MSALERTAEQIALLRRFSGQTGDKFGNIPLPRTPTKSEMEYVSYARRITTAIRLFTSGLLKQYLKDVQTGYNEEVRRDSWVDDLESFKLELINGYNNILTNNL